MQERENVWITHGGEGQNVWQHVRGIRKNVKQNLIEGDLMKPTTGLVAAPALATPFCLISQTPRKTAAEHRPQNFAQ